ncbi:MAG TPA: GntR family transcriptional regulator [Chloroflexota bacterium]|nr:GntR family transcriptional regulator [Chloroflexota bacterium]
MAKPVLLANYPDLGERVYEAVREQIVTCELAPGSPLPVVDLARQFGVSLTPVRDALNRLAAEGLVEDVARKGYFVARLDPEDIADLLSARRLIELAAVEEGIGRIQSDQLVELKRLFEEMRQLFDGNGNCLDYAEFSRRDSQFHQLVVGTAGNEHLVHIYRSLSVHVHIYRTNLAAQGGYRRSLAGVREHEAILVAFESRDLPALKAAISAHVRGVLAEFSGNLRSDPQ